jgi:hypothetical protein
MPAIVTDQFRILNANNFIESVKDPNNSYYVFLSLPNPEPSVTGFGRVDSWDSNVPNPIDNFDYEKFYQSVMLFGKKINEISIRRLIRRVDWIRSTRYEMYRNDYSIINRSPITKSSRLYDANYYVMNSDFRVYICIDNGSSGNNILGNESQDEPTFTDLEPSRAGSSNDGYVWKYLFTVSPSDIIKFDSTEYISVPNDWDSSTNPQIVSIRENGDSSINKNQIKKIYIENSGFGYPSYTNQIFNIIGDGEGGTVSIDTDSSGRIVSARVSSGGSGYTYGMVDLRTSSSNAPGTFAKLIPIIPPSKGHGYDLYKELGTDKVLVYARFDDSTKNFPIDTRFCQVGILKNPTTFNSTDLYSSSEYSSLYSIKIKEPISGTLSVGSKIRQTVSDGIAISYVASYDEETKVIKYFRDRSLFFNPNPPYDQTDYVGLSTSGKVLNFESSTNAITSPGGFNAAIDIDFTGITTTVNNKIISLGTQYTNGLANPEINKETGDIIYLDNRPLVNRNIRQKEDIKIILEF